MPSQVILGKAIEAVGMAADSIEGLGKYSALTNFAIQLSVSGSMAQMWSMVNGLQIILSFNYLNLNVPGNVVMVATNLVNMI